MFNLNCANNLFTSLTLPSSINLSMLQCQGNALTSLDVSNNTGLQFFDCNSNAITSLDLSTNTALTTILCADNQLSSLNIQNGFNSNLVIFDATTNPLLTCIQVDDPSYMNANWSAGKDAGATYSTVCPLPCIVSIPDTNFKKMHYRK
ncbi:MAG: hypothetical protein IPO27_05110 [Bacteroidetes bacterium]|nr:hypothetical protein [Bacteroidota bacterium]